MSRTAAVLLLFSLTLPAYSQGVFFKELIIFGDSLSDTGNLATIAGDFPDPPFFQNRVGNGPVAVELLAEQLGLGADASLHLIGPEAGANYAVAGARARALIPVNSDIPIGLPSQIDAFLLNRSGVAAGDALYVVFIGGNDIRDARDAPRETARSIIREASDGIEDAIRVLAGSGARMFFVVNSPDIGSVPETLSIAEAGEGDRFIAQTTRRTQRFNNRLSRKLQRLKSNLAIELVEFDLFGFVRFIVAIGPAIGFENTAESCLALLELGACDFDSFAFFDEFHPSAAVQALAGVAFHTTLTDVRLAMPASGKMENIEMIPGF